MELLKEVMPNEVNAHLYQKAAMKWIIDKPKCGLFLDMGLGLGKTVTTLTALDYLMYQEFEIDKV